MKHLVIGVSLDSSLDLLATCADIVTLDEDPSPPNAMKRYETLYIRSHFSTPELMPQKFCDEIDDLVRRARQKNPHIIFIDDMNSVDSIIAFEDKWTQYQTFTDFMPHSQLFDKGEDLSGFTRPIFKHRLASRGIGVTWDKKEVTGPLEDWIVQESIDIAEELRVYIIRDEVYPVGAVRHSMTAYQKTEAIDSRQLTQDEVDFSSDVIGQAAGLDIVGLDIARTTDGQLRLIEVNRSPGFAKFEQITGINLADKLYEIYDRS